MIVTFPNLETLQLALTMGVVPTAVSLAPGIAGSEKEGRVWIQPQGNLSRSTQNELRRLGVQMSRAAAASPGTQVRCWLELLPLRRSSDTPARPDQTPVLFELVASEQLPTLIAEMLRLDNDRQSFRWLEIPGAGGETCRALLRVVAPPYYSVLRALDTGGEPTAPTAYVEQSPRVWVQLGYRHPLGDHIKAPAGQILLLRSPRHWQVLEDVPFRDIYDVMEFLLPSTPTRWREGKLTRKLTVPLRLTHGSSPDTPELWVLRDDALGQLDALVHEADDELLGRLAFAVGLEGERQTIILRVRPSRLAPPELVLRGVGFRHYLKLPNLFVPVGTRLHPRLRRDAVRQRLADDPARITWLYPGPQGTFTPESVPDTAFRPLADWIDYILEHDHQALQTWVESTRFDFERFLSEDDVAPGARPGKPPPGPREKTSSAGKGEAGFQPANARPAGSRPHSATDGMDTLAAEGDQLITATEAERAKLHQELQQLESRFLEIEGGMDAPERVALWPPMARLNSRLSNPDEAARCWINILWLTEEDRLALAWNWFQAAAAAIALRTEAGHPRERSWAGGAALASRGAEVDGEDLDWLLSLRDPSMADVGALAAYLFWASCRSSPPAAALPRLGRLQHFLETHESLIPVRAIWLGWLGVAQLAQGDVLALARARDRLLERLYQNGLRPEIDLPGFFRFAGQAGGQGSHLLRQWLPRLCEKVQRWIAEKGRIITLNRQPQTGAYVNLIFAYGLARLGESDAARRLLRQATTALQDQGEAHEFLLEAFRYRIDQALAGQPNVGPLPPEQMEYLADIIQRRKEAHITEGIRTEYIIDRLRHQSRILEPEQKVDPYRDYRRIQNDLVILLGELPEIMDREELARRVNGLIFSPLYARQGPELKAHFLKTALDQAPRVGENFALGLLDQVPPIFEALLQGSLPVDFRDQADLLEISLFVAAHFGRTEYTQQFVGLFQRLLLTQRNTPEALDSLAAQCFRGLRKLGMHREIDQLLQQIATLLLRGQELNNVDADWGQVNQGALRVLLEVAGGWYYFGRDRQAETIVQVARAVLFSPIPRSKEDRPILKESEVVTRTRLACAYAGALGQGHVEVMQKRLEELFEKLDGIIDRYVTNDYYSQCQLGVVEAVVRAIVGDGASLGANLRRWLDDDEFLVRRRIHDDVARLVPH